jgi:hypothetical protein
MFLGREKHVGTLEASRRLWRFFILHLSFLGHFSKAKSQRRSSCEILFAIISDAGVGVLYVDSTGDWLGERMMQQISHH